jgi:ATP-binding cassette, subfamily B, bacterial
MATERLKPRERTLQTWRDRFAAMRFVFPLLKLVWQTKPSYSLAMVILRLVRSVVPVATLWIGKLIIDFVVAYPKTGGKLSQLWILVAAELVIVTSGEALARASALVESLLGDLFSNYSSVKLMEHAATLDLYHFEDPVFYDRLERARRQTTGRIGLFTKALSMGQDILTLFSFATAILLYNPWILLLLLFAVLPSFLGETHFASLQYSLFFRWTPERRRLDYIRYMGASDETAKEVQVFGLGKWLVDRYRNLADRFYEENKQLSIRKAVVSTGLSVIGTFGYYGAYVLILYRAVRGLLSIGSLTFLAGSFARSRDLIERILLGVSDIAEQSLYLKDLFDFFEMKPTIISPPLAVPVPNPIRQGFVFENVGFQYPGSDRWAVRNVSFELHPGEKVAFVGENGAGKTTLTKLIGRLYDPTEGRILLDGVDLRQYELASIRRAIGVIFQDFVEYDLPFDENIGVGEIEKVRPYFDASDHGNGNQPKPNNVPPPIISAAEKSLAATLLSRLPEGYRQMLGRRFEMGVDLSGGEWQKVALGRAYMRDAQLLILDEPTAALDARAEYDVFQRFSQLVGGRMAIIISHRFSTVRMADRIIVLNQGKIVEEGNHLQLLSQKGLYAELFSLQAEGYR